MKSILYDKNTIIYNFLCKNNNTQNKTVVVDTIHCMINTVFNRQQMLFKIIGKNEIWQPNVLFVINL